MASPPHGQKSSGGANHLYSRPRKSRILKDFMRQHSSLGRSSSSEDSRSFLAVEAIFLNTFDNTNISYRRAIYTLPTASISNLVPPEGCDISDSLHVFAGTSNNIQILFRLGERNARRLFIHEALIVDGAVRELFVENSGLIPNTFATSSTGYLYTLPTRIVNAEREEGLHMKTKRIQIFDHDRKLLFTKEWSLDTGIVNNDALSWLKEFNFSLDSYFDTPKNIFENTLSISADNTGVTGRSTSEDGVSSSGTEMEEEEDLFVNVDTAPRHSRSNSVITFLGPVEKVATFERKQKTIDMLQQLGFWIYGSRVGQILANSDRRENYKDSFTASPIWLLGKEYVNDDETANLTPFTLPPLKRLINISGPSEKLESPIIDLDKYTIRETLIVSHMDTNLIMAHIVTLMESLEFELTEWIHEEQGSISSSFTSNKDTGLKFSLKIIKEWEDSISYLDSMVSSSQVDSLEGRTFLMDMLSQLMVLLAMERRKTSIEFAFLDVKGASIQFGPQPESLIPLLSLDHSGSSVSNYKEITLSSITRPESILLWSEHIHDWVLRRLSFRETLMVLSSPLAVASDPLQIDISRSQVYLFNDGSFRFAISYSTSTWFCLQARTHEDFTALLRLLLILVKALPICIDMDQRQTLTPVSSQSSITSTTCSQRSEDSRDMKSFYDSFEALFWFTYRKDMPRLLPSILTSDAGFGCMIRAGQSMMAEALARIYFGSDRTVVTMLNDPESINKYQHLLSHFLDIQDPRVVFSLPNLARVGMELGTPLGQFFAPSILAQALSIQHKARPEIPCEIEIVKNGVFDTASIMATLSIKQRPLVLLMPLRLGADTLNNDYSHLIRTALQTPLTLGIIGGRSGRAYYIVGMQDEALLYLDPHCIKPACTDWQKIISSREYHTRSVCELALSQLDPTLLFGFLLQSVEDYRNLTVILSAIPMPMQLFSFQP